MRRVVLQMGVTLDGYVAGPGVPARSSCHTAAHSCVPLPAFLLLILGSPDLADQPALAPCFKFALRRMLQAGSG
jgi:hypothetical protein